ncbi:VWA domain-containing protein [Streptomyces sp. NPDC014733]|uniref:vWA domain-containing protein n=1 Tax=Streptomyces sp. NPDC014733 TaxID=3364885 RepID=UPI003701A111
MGIRSLLRNAFGRSKATREESGTTPSGTETPEPATPATTIPEAREESAPGTPADRPAAEAPATEEPAPEAPATEAPAAEQPAPERPVAEVPAARTAPQESTTEPETPTVPAQAGHVDDRVEQSAPEPEPQSAPEAAATPDEATESAKDAEVTEDTEGAKDAKDAEATETTAENAKVTEAPEAAETDTAPTEPKTTEVTEATEATEAVEATEPVEAAEAVQAIEAVEEAPAGDRSAAATPGSSALRKAEAAAPALVSLVKSAAATLDKHGLGTQRAAVYLVLDRSGSMRNYYKDGTVQHLAEQALGLSANLDDDGVVPVVFFSTDVDGTAELDLTRYEGRIAELHAGLGHMGRTNYHWAIDAVVQHYKKSGSTAPAFVIFQTDGAPTSKPAAEKALCEAAGLPIFWQFVGFGDPEAKGFDFLRKLDDLAVPEKRVVDNAGFFHAGRDPRALSADELYQQLMVEFPEWLTEARTAGVLKDN